jgi:hypothetical protein
MEGRGGTPRHHSGNNNFKTTLELINMAAAPTQW